MSTSSSTTQTRAETLQEPGRTRVQACFSVLYLYRSLYTRTCGQGMCPPTELRTRTAQTLRGVRHLYLIPVVVFASEQQYLGGSLGALIGGRDRNEAAVHARAWRLHVRVDADLRFGLLL
eukprot:scaffold1832_cov362-Prasinococcus_capsulatus_cf.AAC.3